MSKNIALDIEGREGYLHGTAHQASQEVPKMNEDQRKIFGLQSRHCLAACFIPAGVRLSLQR